MRRISWNAAIVGSLLFGTQAFALPFIMLGRVDPPDVQHTFTVDSANPSVVSIVGASPLPGVEFFTGLDYTADGTLYAQSDVATSLYSVNPGTGDITLVGDNIEGILDLAYNPVDGQMYALALGGELYVYDLSDGSVSLVGTINGLPIFSRGLAVNSAGDFFAINDDQLYSIDLFTFQAAPLPESGPSGYIGNGLFIDWSRDDAIWSVGFISGVPTLVNHALDGSVLSSATLGDGSLILVPGDLAALPIPEPGSLGLLAAAGVVALGYRLRRRAVRVN